MFSQMKAQLLKYHSGVYVPFLVSIYTRLLDPLYAHIIWILHPICKVFWVDVLWRSETGGMPE
jgi:hypothetical protein